jgi:hypothetical protein
MGSHAVEGKGVTIIATEMMAGWNSRNATSVNISESASDVLYFKQKYAYMNKSHSRIMHNNELIMYVQ